MHRSLLCSTALSLILGFTGTLAHAQTVTITDDRKTPVQTSTADNGNRADVVVDEDGSIEVTSGAALTLDSDNSVTNDGLITTTNVDDSTGIAVLGGRTGNVTNTASITLIEEENASEDADDDGDLDGPFAAGARRYGIRVLGPGVFTGSILNDEDALISVTGNQSAGIRLDTAITGSLTNLGTISVTGDDARGVDLRGRVSGDVILRGSINATGVRGEAVAVDASVDGVLRVWGSLTANGFRAQSRPEEEEDRALLDADDLLQGGSALAVRASVAGGIELAGYGVENDPDDDGDGIVDDAEDDDDVDDDDNATSTLIAYGTVPTVDIRASAASGEIRLGPGRDGFGFYGRGNIYGFGIHDGFASVGIRVGGDDGHTVNIAGGIALDRLVDVSSREASAIALLLDDGAVVPLLRHRGSMTASVVSAGNDAAVAVDIRPGASLPSLFNSGSISASLDGATGDAIAVRDTSGTLIRIENTGSIVAGVFVTDEDTDDDEEPEAFGDAIAFDLLANTSGVTILQVEDVPFTDDDTEDDDEDSRPTTQIVGDILLGSGNDQVILAAGSITGNIAFGAGDDLFLLAGASTFTGFLTDSDGRLRLDVRDAQLDLDAGIITVSEAVFRSGTDLRPLIGNTSSNVTVIEASGTVTFEAGARIVPRVEDGLPQTGTITILKAQRLLGAENVTGQVTGTGVPFLYELTIETVASDANALAATFRLKDADELGLNRNQAAAYLPLVEAMRRDADANVAFASLESAEDFYAAYNELLPNFGTASTELAATSIHLAQRVSSNRLEIGRATTLKNDTFWLQEILYSLDRAVPGYGVDYRGIGVGFAAGYDGPLTENTHLGISLAVTGTNVREPDRREGSISNTMGQANVYLGLNEAGFAVDLLAGVGGGRLNSRRGVAIGDDYAVTAEASWWSAEGHASAKVSYPVNLGRHVTLLPHVGLSYVGLWEDGYRETGAGDGVNLVADSVFSQRLWGETGLGVQVKWPTQTRMWSTLSVGYRQELIEETASRTVRFASGGDPFTLYDESTDTEGLLAGLMISGGSDWSVVSLAYEGEFRSGLQRHSLNASVRFRFW